MSLDTPDEISELRSLVYSEYAARLHPTWADAMRRYVDAYDRAVEVNEALNETNEQLRDELHLLKRDRRRLITRHKQRIGFYQNLRGAA